MTAATHGQRGHPGQLGRQGRGPRTPGSDRGLIYNTRGRSLRTLHTFTPASAG